MSVAAGLKGALVTQQIFPENGSCRPPLLDFPQNHPSAAHDFPAGNLESINVAFLIGSRALAANHLFQSTWMSSTSIRRDSGKSAIVN